MTESNKLLSEARQQAADGQFDVAEEVCRRLLSDDPRQIEVLQLLAGICFQQHRHSEAVGHLKNALQIEPADSSLHYALGSISWVTGAIDQAITSYQRALEIDPPNAEIENDLGVALNAKGKYAEAEIHLRNSLRLVPDQVSTLINLGNALKNSGNLDEAVDCYRKSLEIEPDKFMGHCSLGMALMQLARFDEAVKAAEILGLNRNTLRRKLQERGIRPQPRRAAKAAAATRAAETKKGR